MKINGDPLEDYVFNVLNIEIMCLV